MAAASVPRDVTSYGIGLAAPLALFFLVFFVAPLVQLFVLSLHNDTAGVVWGIGQYVHFLTDPFSLSVLGSTLLLGAEVTPQVANFERHYSDAARSWKVIEPVSLVSTFNNWPAERGSSLGARASAPWRRLTSRIVKPRYASSFSRTSVAEIKRYCSAGVRNSVSTFVWPASVVTTAKPRLSA